MITARREISLPEDLCASAERRFAARYEGLEGFIEFVLREILRDDVEELDKAEKSVLEKRLRDLGYL